MSILLSKLKGNLSLDEAMEARVRNIQEIAHRSSSYVLTTVQHKGFSQTELHPGKRKVAPASPKRTTVK